jgi:hypothetical protein
MKRYEASTNQHGAMDEVRRKMFNGFIEESPFDNTPGIFDNDIFKRMF